MAIYFFMQRCNDGAGDLVQTVKTADHVQKTAEAQGKKVIIVVPDADKFDHEAITKGFVNDINTNIEVQTISFFKKSNPQIDGCIEAGYSTFDWKEEIKDFINEETPLILMSEYNSPSIWTVGNNNTKKLYSGFNATNEQVGVIPSQALLEATAGDTISDEAVEQAFNRLDPKLQKHLGGDAQSYQNYRSTHNFSYQYSHDRNEYESFHFVKENGAKKVVYTDSGLKPVDLYLQEHNMLTESSNQSQVVLCIGGENATKKEALIKLKDSLIDNGYSKITFVDVDEDTEEILHNDPDQLPEKEYRVLYSATVPFSTMQSLPILADNIVGATGDNSAIEAMSAGKLVSYECIQHKSNFVSAYLKEVGERTENPDVKMLAALLMKGTRNREINYDKNQIKELLQKKEVVDELKGINRAIVSDSQYFNQLDMAMSELNILDIKADKTSELKDSTNDLKSLTIDSLESRFPMAFSDKDSPHAQERDYHEEIRQLAKEINQLDNPDQSHIQSVTDKWFSTITLSQQNRFRGEMPLMVNDAKDLYLNQLRPNSKVTLSAEARSEVLTLMKQIRGLYNPDESKIVNVIEEWQKSQNPGVKTEIDKYLSDKGIQKEPLGNKENPVTRFKGVLASYDDKNNCPQPEPGRSSSNKPG